MACRCWGQYAKLSSVHVLINRQDEVDAASDSRFAVMGAKSITCVVNRIYGRAASGIYSEAIPSLESLPSINFKAARLALGLSDQMCSQSYY